MLNHIYAIHTRNDPDTYLYVGRSVDPKGRLAQHITESTTGTTTKCKVFSALIKQGEQLDYIVLDSGDTVDEDLWVINMAGSGHPLTNSKAGDQEQELFTLDPDHVKQPWTVDLFVDAKWEKGLMRCKANEWSVWIKGVQFFRTGQSKLRMWHVDYGTWEIGGFDMAMSYKNAVEMLTTGTERHKRWMKSYKTASALRPDALM